MTPETKTPTRAEALAIKLYAEQLDMTVDEVNEEMASEEGIGDADYFHAWKTGIEYALSATDAPIVEGTKWNVSGQGDYDCPRDGWKTLPELVDIASKAYAQGRTQSAVPIAEDGWDEITPIDLPLEIIRDCLNAHTAIADGSLVDQCFKQLKNRLSAAPPVTGGAWRTDEPPKDGTPIYARFLTPMRFMPYKPNSQQAKSGQKGRWQAMNEYGGWDNCGYGPMDWMARADYHAMTTPPSSAEKEGV